MKKIPTVFIREYEEKGKICGIRNEFTNRDCEIAFRYGVATVKLDGTCCAVIHGELYRRFDAKAGRKIPEGAIPCCDPDPITGHWPHWVKCSRDNQNDKYHFEGYDTLAAVRYMGYGVPDGTYELLGPKVQGNPYNVPSNLRHILAPHGSAETTFERTFESVKTFLKEATIEGIVFWYGGQPVCKIKRSDFGFPWPVRKPVTK